jgi:membrane dipeptidase
LDLAYNALVLGRDLRSPLEEVRAGEVKSPPPDKEAGVALTTVPTLIDGRVAVVGGSIFVAPAGRNAPEGAPHVYANVEEAHTYGRQQLDYYRRLGDEDERVRLIGSAGDLEEVLSSWETESPRVGVFVVMEGAAPIRSPDEVGLWVEEGLRGIGLTWAVGTIYAGGNGNPGPLTDEGRDLLRTASEFNLLVDISHLWEDAAYDVLSFYPGPIGATHANPRAFVDSPRLLSDDLIRRLADREGVMGIVPFNRMLEPGWNTSQPRLPQTRVVEAIDYVCQLLGSASHVGIGSDFDGGFGLRSVPAGLGSGADLGKIGELLLERGYAPEDVEAILHGNWLRLMRRALEAF